MKFLEVDAKEKYEKFLRDVVPVAIQKLKEDSKPQWGDMLPRHMVEHLEVALTGSTIVREGTPKELEGTRKEIKEQLIYSPQPMPKFLQNPMFEGGLPPFRHPDLETAKSALLKWLEKFFKTYEKSPEHFAFGMFLGDLFYEEWLVFHYKHLTHHFTQFELI